MSIKERKVSLEQATYAAYPWPFSCTFLGRHYWRAGSLLCSMCLYNVNYWARSILVEPTPGMCSSIKKFRRILIEMDTQQSFIEKTTGDETQFSSRACSQKCSREKDLNALAGVGLVFGIALVVRLMYVWQIRSMPFFDAPIIDANMYDQSATDLLQSLVEQRPFYQAPLYSYFLALIYRIFGHDYLVPRLIQSAIGAVNCVMVALIGKRLFGKRQGLLAGCIAALYGPFIHFEGELLRPVLIIFLGLSMILCILSWSEDRHIWAAIAGLLMGLSAITRENILIVLPVIVMYLWMSSKKSKWHAPVLFIALTIIPLIPVTVNNYKKSGDFVPVSSQGGMNFYIGNSADSDRLTGLQPGREWDKMAFSPREELGPHPKPSEFQSWFIKKAFKDISQSPTGWIGKLVKKLYLVFYGEELTPNSNLDLYRDHSFLLSVLIFKWGPLFIPFGLLFPFFVLGIGVKGAKRDKGLLIGFIMAYALSLMLFHVRARYRVPIVPLMIPFAAAGILHLIKQIHIQEVKKVAHSLFVLACSAVLVNATLVDVSFAKRFPTNYFVGQALYKKGHDELALEEFKKGLEKDPHFPELRRVYGHTLIRLGRLEDGLEQITLARDLAPDYAPIRQDLGKLYQGKARKLKARITARSKGNSPTIDEAELLEEIRQLQEIAIKEYEAAEKDDPYDESIKYELALLYDQAGYHDNFTKKLEEYAEQQMKGNPDYAIGLVLDQLGRLDEAATHYTAALRISSDKADIHHKLGVVYFRKAAYEKARDHFDESIRTEPENDEAHFYLGNILEMFGRHREAIAHFTESLRINPDNPLAHHNLALALVQQRDLAKALEHYAKAIRLDPKSAEFHNNMGVAFFASNEYGKSVKHYNSAIELNPRYMEAYNNLGNVLVQQGMFDEAIKNYHMALRINPDHPEALNNIGVAFARQKKYQQAIEYFNRALNLKPNYLQARKNLELASEQMAFLESKTDKANAK
jgi:tetratricopeptide (TPR) repeat protein